MTSLTIIDSGYNTSARDGTANSGSDINNTSTYKASTVTLKSKGIRLKSGALIADEPNPSSNEPAAVHYVIFSNRLYDIDYTIDIQNESDRNILKDIAVLERTSGIKILYMSTASDTLKTIVEILGRTDTKFHGNEISTNIPAIIGRVKGISINQVSKSRKYAISGKITFEEEKVET